MLFFDPKNKTIAEKVAQLEMNKTPLSIKTSEKNQINPENTEHGWTQLSLIQDKPEKPVENNNISLSLVELFCKENKYEKALEIAKRLSIPNDDSRLKDKIIEIEEIIKRSSVSKIEQIEPMFTQQQSEHKKSFMDYFDEKMENFSLNEEEKSNSSTSAELKNVLYHERAYDNLDTKGYLCKLPEVVKNCENFLNLLKRTCKQ